MYNKAITLLPIAAATITAPLFLTLTELTWRVNVDALCRRLDEVSVRCEGSVGRKERSYCARLQAIRGREASLVSLRLVIRASDCLSQK